MAISVRDALTPDEEKFCRVYLGFKGKNKGEAYRRAFYVLHRGEYYEPAQCTSADEPREGETPADARLATKRAETLLKQAHIQSYITELSASTSEHARQTLAREVISGDSSTELKAAQEVLKQEDKLGFRDAALLWAQIMCEVGAEVVVELPERFQRVVVCKCCGEETYVDEPIEVSIPMAEMFPNLTPSEEEASA